MRNSAREGCVGIVVQRPVYHVLRVAFLPVLACENNNFSFI